MSDAHKAVFLSYASQDAEAAKRICETLRAAGVEVWFDQSELVGGDQWDGKIRGQIGSCALFVPIISANTQARLEGYFRIEWKLAARRTHAMASAKAFLVPVVIDDTPEAGAHVPDEFRDVQWTRLPRGENAATFVTRVNKLLSGEGRLGAGDGALRVTEQASRLSGSPRLGRKWLRPILAAAVILGGMLAVALVRRSAPAAPSGPSPLAVPAKNSASRPDVAQLLDRVRATTAKFDDILHTELDSMEELLGQAAKLDPADASVWAQWALVDCRYLNHSFDQTPARRDAARRHAAQAAGLDPDRAEVRLAQADVMMTLSRDTTRAEVTRILRPLLAETPADGRIPLLLGWLAYDTTRPEAALAWFDQATQIPGYALAGHFAKARMLFWSGRLSEGEAELNLALAAGTSAEVLLWKALLFATWRGDLLAARRTLAEVPPQSFVEDMPAAARYRLELLSRNYEQALAALRTVPHDYLQSDAYRGPVGYLSGIALAEAGKKAAAELEWRSALATVESRLRADPNGRELMQFKALLQALLGDLEAGRKTFRAVQELYGTYGSQAVALQLQFLPADEAYAWVAGKVAKGSGDVTAALLHLDPVFAAIRSDPRFPSLLAQAEADPRLSPKAGAKPAAGEIPAKIEAKSVAVLAFANLSDDKGNEYFSDGISEELLNVLAKIPGLKVTARTSSFHFKGKDTPIPEIAQQLGVAYVIEGSVRKQGDKVRITAQLIKAADGFHVWSENYDRELKDIFAIQSDVAGRVAAALQVQMLGARNAPTANLQAYEKYQAGRFWWNKRTKAGMGKAVAAYQEAIALDPDYADASAGLAAVYTLAPTYLGTPQAEAQPKARAAALRALELDPGSAEARAVLGSVAESEYDWSTAVKDYRQAIDLNPNYATAHLWLANDLAAQGRLPEARAAIRRARELDPLSLIIQAYEGWTEIALGNHDEAIQIIRQGLELDPNFLVLHEDLGSAYLGKGMVPEAVKEFRMMRSLDSQGPYGLGELGYALALSGDREGARAVLREIEGWRSRGLAVDFQSATVWLGLGEIDQAYGCLDRAEAAREFMIDLKVFPRWQVLHADPRWTKLMGRMNLAP